MFLLFSPVSGLHLAVLHKQAEALKSLSRVVSVLAGEEVLNMRNHLYQVNNYCFVFLDIFQM